MNPTLGDARARRRRYQRRPADLPVSLTPGRVCLLAWLVRLELASLPQLARLLSRSEKATRRLARVLFDAGLVDVVPVARFALADYGSGLDPALLYGSAPNVYVPTRTGIRSLIDLGVIDLSPPLLRLSNRTSSHLAHALGVRDVRVWLETCARSVPNARVRQWRVGSSAEITLGGSTQPRAVKPDAWFVLPIGAKSLVGFVEYDRGSERVGVRWRDKLTAYQTLYAGAHIQSLTNCTTGRVLVIASSAQRRDTLARYAAERLPAELTNRFWFTERTTLSEGTFDAAVWLQPGRQQLTPLLPRQALIT